MRALIATVVGALVATTLTPVTAAPDNDDLAQAQPIAHPAAVNVALTEATREPFEPSWCGANDDVTVWYRLDAAMTEMLLMRTVQPTTVFSHSMAVYVGNDMAALDLITCHSSSSNLRGLELNVPLTAGTTYMIQVGGDPARATSLRLSVSHGAGGIIAGTVTATDGAPIGGICVDTFGSAPAPGGVTITRPDGTYALPVPSGTHGVMFQDCQRLGYNDEFYDDVHEGVAQRVDVAPLQTRSGVDAVLERVGTIAGRIVGPQGEPARSVCVYLWREDRDLSPWPHRTNASGQYRFDRLLPRVYRVRFADCRTTPIYAGEWYDDEPTWRTATPIVLEEGEHRTDVDAQLAAA